MVDTTRLVRTGVVLTVLVLMAANIAILALSPEVALVVNLPPVGAVVMAALVELLYRTGMGVWGWMCNSPPSRDSMRRIWIVAVASWLCCVVTASVFAEKIGEDMLLMSIGFAVIISVVVLATVPAITSMIESRIAAGCATAESDTESAAYSASADYSSSESA